VTQTRRVPTGSRAELEREKKTNVRSLAAIVMLVLPSGVPLQLAPE
jgi:hypothetical protein